MKKTALMLVMLVALLLFGCAAQETTNNPNATAAATIGASIQATQGGNSVTAQNGDLVAVDYVGTLDDGTVFDTSIKEEAQKAGLPLRPSYSPLEFTVGAGQMISGFDKGVVGMTVGETKNVHLTPAEAYGNQGPLAGKALNFKIIMRKITKK